MLHSFNDSLNFNDSTTPQLKRQVLLFEPGAAKPAEWNEHTLFWINHVMHLILFFHNTISPGVCLGEERESTKAREDKLDRKAPALHREDERGGERWDPSAEDPENPGGDHQDTQDEEKDLKRPAADRAGGHPEEHVLAQQEADQGADRVVDRAQVYEEGRRQY